mgnify:CR=1 FL=1
MKKRVFWLVMDSVGTGEMPDAARYGDEGSNTLRSVSRSPFFQIPYLLRLGLANIDQCGWGQPAADPQACFGRLGECSPGKDTTTGHWEMAGVITKTPFPTFTDTGFPPEVMHRLEEETGLGFLGNIAASGTEIIQRLGDEHLKTGYPIVYTSADSVFQIAAHESLFPPEKLYALCETARNILTGPYGVARVIARPFTGTYGNYVRTKNRRDFSLPPTGVTVLDLCADAGLTVASVGKIEDIFAQRGITRRDHATNNSQAIEGTLRFLQEDFPGLIFTNLVDFDMVYGHRNDPVGYARALEAFDAALPNIMAAMKKEDVLFLTADHGCDPTTASTDHSREYVPLLIYGNEIRSNVDLGIRSTFADLGKTICEGLGLKNSLPGESFWKDITNV